VFVEELAVSGFIAEGNLAEEFGFGMRSVCGHVLAMIS